MCDVAEGVRVPARDESLVMDDAVSIVCGAAAEEVCLLLRDSCNAATHTFCLELPLDTVPAGRSYFYTQIDTRSVEREHPHVASYTGRRANSPE